MNRLAGKIAIITGGNSGVGAAAAKLFAAEGATVAITARRAEALEQVAQEIRDAGGTVLAVPTDISKPGDPERLVQAVLDQFGRIVILVNNAGVLEKGLKPIDRFTDEDLDRIVETNEKGSMRCIRAVSPHMESGSSIVNLVSVAGVVGNGGAAYVASKAAMIGITRHTALRFQSKGIRCNAVCPGTILTPMVKDMTTDSLDPDMIGAMAAHANMQTQPCTAQDVANILLFLACDESRALTGQVLVSDFGSTL